MGSKMNLKKLRVKLATHYNYEVIDGLFDAALGMRQKIEADLSKAAKEIEADPGLGQDEKDFQIHSLGDDIYIAELTTSLAGEMMVIALFKTTEIAIKGMAASSDLFTKTELASFYKVDQLKKAMKATVCDLTKLLGFKAYDELRCINNAIKHSGVASKELARYANWREGQKLDGLNDHYARLKNDVIVFVEELQKKILAKIT